MSYYMISLLPAHISFSCVDSILFLPGVKRLIGMLGLVVDTASSITSAIEVFNELKVESKILVSLKNYCKWSVSVVSIEIIQGVTRSGMASLPAGEEGGWTASQDEGLFADVGTEGYAAWTMSTHSFCAIYWRVGDQETNAMGVGCRPYSDNVDDWEKTIQDVKQSKSELYIEYEEYDTSQRVIQYCNTHICIQGILFSASDGEAKIEVFPLDVADVAPSLGDSLTQEMIDGSSNGDDKFGDPANRVRENGLSEEVIIGIVIGSIAGLCVLVAGCYYCYKKGEFD